MHRAAVRAFRTSYQCTVRGLSRASRRGILVPPSNPSIGPLRHGLRRAAYHSTAPGPVGHGSTPGGLASEPLRSSMYIRRFSVALVSTLVGYGAWYSYKGPGSADHQLSRSFASSAATATGASDAVPTRHVLVVGADELHTGTVIGEGPISKTTLDDGRRVLEMFTPDQATQRLRQSEESYLVNRGKGVVRYDLVQLPSNDPIEDDHAEKIVEVPSRSEESAVPNGNSDWMFWGVFDGHSGWTTSAKLRQSLISFVARELNSTYKAAPGRSPAADAIDSAIKAAFTKLDNEIVHESVQKVLKANSQTIAAELLAPALSGSCALISFYDTTTKTLRVACTGDSRAVLGRRSSSGKWTATQLSVDQTGSNPEEEARMRKLHPDEEHVIRNGRVLGGLEPTRAFGDASYKWSRDISEKLRRSFFGRTPSPLLKSPPYVTAEPVITTTQIQPDKGDFVVMASDGLWEMLTNEEVVGLVGKWIETQQANGGKSQFDSVWSKIFGSAAATPLPIEQDPKKKTESTPEGQKTPIRQQQWGVQPDRNDRFIVKDKNVATHLIRNALGGRNEEQVCALLTLPSPYSRRFRDDLTVQVIFFGEGEKSGEVVMNPEATGPSKQETPIKAKL